MRCRSEPEPNLRPEKSARHGLRVWLRRLHLWIGLSGGVVFALLALGGCVLLFENELLELAYPQLAAHATRDGDEGAALQRVLAAAGHDVRSVQFPDRRLPVWQVTKPDGTGWYFDDDGRLLLRRTPLGDPLGVIHAWHTRLIVGRGHQLVGCVGFIALFMLLSGAWIYWPGRARALKHLRLHLQPPTLRWASWHRAVGVMMLPLLLAWVSMGIMLGFHRQAQDALTAVFGGHAPARTPVQNSVARDTNIDWSRVMRAVHAAQPTFTPARLFLPGSRGGGFTLRGRFPGEWSDGASSIDIDPRTARVLAVDDARDAGLGTRISMGLLPVHSAAAGGAWWRAIALCTGLTPTVLLVLGFLFWLRRRRAAKL